MEKKSVTDEAFDVGTWVGRKQAFSLVAGRCLAADAEILFEIREKKLFRTMEPTWEDFCVKRLGITRGYVDRTIRQFKELGPHFAKLSSFTRIKPAEYRLIAGSITDDGLTYSGEVIALEPENAPKLARAVEALRRDATPSTNSVDSTEQALARATRTMQLAILEFRQLQVMDLDGKGRSRLLATVGEGRNQLDHIYRTTKP